MIIGHQKQWEIFKKIAEEGNFSHAYLFAGQDKLGKKRLALEWISLLFGKKEHPDLILIEPQKKEIQITQIRELIWKLSLKPYSAPLKAAIIDQAHSMTRDSQTCLLKTLEEPKGKALLILITEYPESLFPTILSRVETIKFFPVKKEEIKNYLKKHGISEKEREEISQASLGKPGIAIDLISNPEKLKEREEKIKELISLSNSQIATRFQYANNLSKEPKKLSEILEIWLSYFRNILLSKVSGDDFSKYSLAKIKNIIKLIQRTNFFISTTNINPRLALEILMLEI